MFLLWIFKAVAKGFGRQPPSLFIDIATMSFVERGELIGMLLARENSGLFEVLFFIEALRLDFGWWESVCSLVLDKLV